MTAAAPQVAPVQQPEPSHVVRLRMVTHAWTSPGMTRVEAETLAATLLDELVNVVGDTCRFVTFRGRDGKTFDIRGREILAVEVAPEGHAEPPRRRGGLNLGDVQVRAELDAAGPPETGTAWLQQQMSHGTRVPLDRRREQ